MRRRQSTTSTTHKSPSSPLSPRDSRRSTSRATAKISSSPAQRVVASTAGVDSWKTWAGRSHGADDEFEILDLWRGMKKTLQHKLGTKSRLPPTGTNCPVCLTPVEEEENCKDSTSQWHVTWCGCAVCKDCLKLYVQSQIMDTSNTEALKCPICSKHLRKVDAMAALKGDDKLISEWDKKIRNNLLRALPSYRPCPNCTNGGGTHDTKQQSSEGGGFVTPECLAPHYHERQSNATEILKARYAAPIGVLFLYFGYAWLITRTPSTSVLVDLAGMLIPAFVFLKLAVASQLWVATQARSVFFRPITVGCPCCNFEFILPTEVNSKMYNDDQTDQWMKTNTRPCPSCSVPISKISGCNHMKCSHCGVQFCWACMHSRTSCRAYRCNNRAPFGDASPPTGGDTDNDDGGRDRRQQHRRRPPGPNDSVLTIIDYLLDQPYPNVGFKDGLTILGCLIGRHVQPIRFMVHSLMSVFTSILFTNSILQIGVWYVLRMAYQDLQERRRRQQRRNQNQVVDDGLDMNMVFGINQNGVQRQNIRRPREGQQHIHRLERDMIAEALRRSMEEQ